MCGIAGFLSERLPTHEADSSRAVLLRMGDAIAHRGPDDADTWFDQDVGIGLSHRRLSILDLSAAGHQPMQSPGGRFVIVFNGEIYNHLDLRNELERHRGDVLWRGHSDTETLLVCFESMGVLPTLRNCIGMFAFALWDRELQTLTLGRDRLGEKPLYFGWQGEAFLFGSELKALKAHPAFVADVDRNCITLLMRYNYIPAPFSVYEGISKLQPGCVLTVSLKNRDPVIESYWSGPQVIEACRATPFSGSADEAVLALENLLKDSISKQMLSERPSRCVSFRGHRFVDGRRADASAVEPSCAHVFDWLQRGRL